MQDAKNAGNRALAATVVHLEGTRPEAARPDTEGSEAAELPEVVIRSADSIAETDKVELGGYCPVALVRRGGLLLPAATDLGFVQFDGRLFGCSSRAFFQDFAANPIFYAKKASTWPVLCSCCAGLGWLLLGMACSALSSSCRTGRAPPPYLGTRPDGAFLSSPWVGPVAIRSPLAQKRRWRRPWRATPSSSSSWA